MKKPLKKILLLALFLLVITFITSAKNFNFHNYEVNISGNLTVSDWTKTKYLNVTDTAYIGTMDFSGSTINADYYIGQLNGTWNDSVNYYTITQLDNATIIRSHNTSWKVDNSTNADLLAGQTPSVYLDDTTIGNCSTQYSCSLIVYAGNTSWVKESQEYWNGTDANFSNTETVTLNVTGTTTLNNITCPDGTCEIDSNFNISDDLAIQGNNIYFGYSEGNRDIFFYEGGNPRGRFFGWDDGSNVFVLNDRLIITGGLTAELITGSTLKSTGDIYSTGAGNGLWLGHVSPVLAGFQAYADGRVIATGDITANSFNGSWNGSGKYLTNGTDINVLDINASSGTVHGNWNTTGNLYGEAIYLDGDLVGDEDLDIYWKTGATTIAQIEYTADALEIDPDVVGGAGTTTITGDAVVTGDIGGATATITGLGSFGNLDVDTLNFNGNTISDSTNTISFSNDNLETTGTLSANKIRITSVSPDMEMANRGDRLTFRPVSDGHNIVEVYTFEGDGNDYVGWNLWSKGLPTSITNRERLIINMHPDGYSEIYTEEGGSGDFRPLKLYTEGNTDQIVLEIDGNITMATLPTITGGTSLVIDGDNKIGLDSSSIDLKKNIVNITDEESSRIYDLKPVKFDSKDGLATDIYGLIAEDVYEVMPELVGYKVERIRGTKINDLGENESYIKEWKQTDIPERVYYTRLITLLLVEVQNLNQKNQMLNARLDETCKLPEANKYLSWC